MVGRWIGIALLCETVGCLPNPGGLFQQEELHVRRLEKVYLARNDTAKDRQEIAEQKRRVEGNGSARKRTTPSR